MRDEQYRTVHVQRGDRKFGAPTSRGEAQVAAERLSRRFAYVEVCLV